MHSQSTYMAAAAIVAAAATIASDFNAVARCRYRPYAGQHSQSTYMAAAAIVAQAATIASDFHAVARCTLDLTPEESTHRQPILQQLPVLQQQIVLTQQPLLHQHLHCVGQVQTQVLQWNAVTVKLYFSSSHGCSSSCHCTSNSSAQAKCKDRSCSGMQLQSTFCMSSRYSITQVERHVLHRDTLQRCTSSHRCQ